MIDLGVSVHVFFGLFFLSRLDHLLVSMEANDINNRVSGFFSDSHNVFHAIVGRRANSTPA